MSGRLVYNLPQAMLLSPFLETGCTRAFHLFVGTFSIVLLLLGLVLFLIIEVNWSIRIFTLSLLSKYHMCFDLLSGGNSKLTAFLFDKFPKTFVEFISDQFSYITLICFFVFMPHFFFVVGGLLTLLTFS